MSWPDYTKGNRFWIADTKICIWRDFDRRHELAHPESAPDFVTRKVLGDDTLFESLKDFFRAHKFTCRMDPHTKKHYKCLSKFRYGGKRGDLEYFLDASGLMTGVEFFQNVVRENQNGGRYDFSKLAKMPYMVRLRYQWCINRLIPLIEAHGYRYSNEGERPKDAMERLRRDRDRDFSGRWAETGNREYIDTLQPYECTDANGVALKEGDTRYSRDYKGHLVRGQVYYGLNHMWKLIGNGVFLVNRGAGAYFRWRPGLERREFDKTTIQHRLDGLLGKAVKAEDFARAAVLKAVRDRLKAA